MSPTLILLSLNPNDFKYSKNCRCIDCKNISSNIDEEPPNSTMSACGARVSSLNTQECKNDDDNKTLLIDAAQHLVSVSFKYASSGAYIS